MPLYLAYSPSLIPHSSLQEADEWESQVIFLLNQSFLPIHSKIAGVVPYPALSDKRVYIEDITEQEVNSDSIGKDKSRDTNIDNRKSAPGSEDQKEMKQDN